MATCCAFATPGASLPSPIMAAPTRLPEKSLVSAPASSPAAPIGDPLPRRATGRMWFVGHAVGPDTHSLEHGARGDGGKAAGALQKSRHSCIFLALPDQGVTVCIRYERNETHPEKRLLGYARVSTYGQTFDSQLEQLRKAGCTSRNIFREKVTGARADRRELNRMHGKLTPGDVVMV